MILMKSELPAVLKRTLKALGGRATIVQVCKRIWTEHETDLRASGDLFYTWQYDIRWAADKLRETGDMRPADQSPRGIWELAATR